jgi:hypothetical protein
MRKGRGMRQRVRLAAATLPAIAATVMALAGCGTGNGNGAGPVTGTVTGSPPASSSTRVPAPVSNTASASATATPGGAIPRCDTSALSVTLGPPMSVSSDGQYVIELIFTNISAMACYLRGYPGVDMVGAITWSVDRRVATPETVVLAPGGRAQAAIAYLHWRPQYGKSILPDHLLVTPPNGSTPLTVPWPGSEALGSQLVTATHPDTYVGTVIPVS